MNMYEIRHETQKTLVNLNGRMDYGPLQRERKGQGTMNTEHLCRRGAIYQVPGKE